jgi:hypothetical protein
MKNQISKMEVKKIQGNLNILSYMDMIVKRT